MVSLKLIRALHFGCVVPDEIIFQTLCDFLCIFASTFMPERRNYNHTTSLLFISLFNYYANLVANQLNNYQFYLILKTLSKFLKSSPEKRIKNKYTFAYVNVRAVIVCICDLFFWDFNFNSVNLIFCCLPYKRKMAIFDYSRF